MTDVDKVLGYLKSLKLSSNTKLVYYGKLTKYLRWCEKNNKVFLTGSSAREFLDDSSKSISIASFKQLLVVVRRFLRYHEITLQYEYSEIPRTVIKKYITQDDIDKMDAYCSSVMEPLALDSRVRARCLSALCKIYIGYYLGIMWNDLIKVTVNDVSIDKTTCSIKVTNTEVTTNNHRLIELLIEYKSTFSVFNTKSTSLFMPESKGAFSCKNSHGIKRKFNDIGYDNNVTYKTLRDSYIHNLVTSRLYTLEEMIVLSRLTRVEQLQEYI